jgi:hypothetical protein
MAEQLPERISPKSKLLGWTHVICGDDTKLCDAEPPEQGIDRSDYFFG